MVDMLTPVEPTDHLPPPAYRVPWRLIRTDSAHPVVINDGPDAADFVRIFRDDDAATERTQLWGQVLSGEQIELCLCSADLDEVVVTIAWFRHSDGLEYVWRFVV